MQLKELSREESLTIEKIQTLTGDLKSAVTQEPSAPAQVPGVVGEPTNARTERALPQVTGRVTVINEQIFTNAHRFSPDQLRRAVQKFVATKSSGTTKRPDDKDVPNIRIEGEKIVRAHSAASILPQGQPPQGDLILKEDHVDAVDTPLTEVTVKVEKPGDTAFTAREFLTDYQGGYTISSPPLPDGFYVFSVKVGDFKTSAPLPYDELKFINLFGTALIRPIRTKITDPLILQPAPPGTVVPATNVLLITVPQINRDYYRVGVGIDLISFVKKLGAGQSK